MVIRLERPSPQKRSVKWILF